MINLKLMFTIALRAITSLGMDFLSDVDQTIDFIAKLDNRWSTLKTQVSNESKRGTKEPPSTLMEAFTIGSDWEISVIDKFILPDSFYKVGIHRFSIASSPFSAVYPSDTYSIPIQPASARISSSVTLKHFLFCSP